MTDATPQPTGSGKLIWRKPLTEDVIELGTLPDPRDARIAELEAALREIAQMNSSAVKARTLQQLWGYMNAIGHSANVALMPPPESDMTITREEWDA